MENKVIDHFCHEHPLILTENVSENYTQHCYSCGNHVNNLEMTYVCIEKCKVPIFHKKCGELPIQISHPKHPQHPLYLTDFHNTWSWCCDLCCRDLVAVLGYVCIGCDFVFDLTCEKISMDAVLEEKSELRHPSHPYHPLILMRKSDFAFYCDGCGDQDADMAYICSICQFWIHKACALLPLILPTDHHHHHLSLAFSIPKEHRIYVKYCDVCGKKFDKTCWVYFCGDCRFFAHLKCASTSKIETATKEDSNLEEDDNKGCDVIQFPLPSNDIAKELITPFVMREKGLTKIPEEKDMPTTMKLAGTTSSFSFLLNYHKQHPLSLVLELLNEEKEEDESTSSESKICDLCVTPISSPPYYECVSCKYFVHFICNLLPETLSLPSSSSKNYPSHLYTDCPSTHNKIHNFSLYTSSEYMDGMLDCCEVCSIITNGSVYECKSCEKKMDVKCASLPTSIRHSSHPHHKSLIMSVVRIEDDLRWKECHGCGYILHHDNAYCCSNNGCDFALHLRCAQLPPSIIRRDWDRHPLMLMFDASLDHPDGFICDFCEGEINPKKWMYHCLLCDYSVHVFCCRPESGIFRNIKFGWEIVLDGIHPHPLTFNCVALIKRCSICRGEVYNSFGLECAWCNFAICLDCGCEHMDKNSL